MDWLTYASRWGIPVLLTAGIFYFYYFCNKNKCSERMKAIDEPRKQFRGIFLLENLKIEIGDWKKSIIAPIIFAVIVELIPAIIFQVNPHGFNEPLWFAGATSGFMNPIEEEFVMRGVLIGFILLEVEERIRFKGAKPPELIRWFARWGAVFIIALAFAVMHERWTPYQFIAIFMKGSLYGTLYLAGNRNLLPPIVAHAAGNWLLILNDSFNYFNPF